MIEQQDALSIRTFKPHMVPRPNSGMIELDFDRPLDIEIGAGVGWHPITYSRENPDRNLIAIEHTKTKFEKFKRRLDNHHLSNLHAVHANAISWITHNLANESVDRLFILYPNPNPKKSDISKRWHAMPFMRKLIDILKPGGTITVATNEEFYIEECIEYMVDHWNMRLDSYENFIRGQIVPRTHFEKKYLENNQLVHNVVFKKGVYQ